MKDHGKVRRHRRNLRRRVWERDGGTCWLCLEVIVGIAAMTLDHVVPKSKGGRATFCNVRAAHGSCNRIRGDKDVPAGYLARAVDRDLTTDERIALQKRDEDEHERYAG